MDEKEYSEFVANLAKNGDEILKTLTSEKCELWHMFFALMIKVGELADPLKKYIIYGKDLDFKNLKEELGDIEYYLSDIRRLLNVTREEILDGNVAKLKERYPSGQYSNEQAINRADKKEPELFTIFDFVQMKVFGPATIQHCLIRDGGAGLQIVDENKKPIYFWSVINQNWVKHE